jgi:hypothetical protein
MRIRIISRAAASPSAIPAGANSDGVPVENDISARRRFACQQQDGDSLDVRVEKFIRSLPSVMGW